MSRKFLVGDLLCGAGGSTTGAVLALLALGYSLDQIVIACVNHWPTAIDTHRRNYPQARHYIQDIATVRPHIVVPEGYLDLLMASPTCTHHSVARGGKPTSDQQRSDPWHIITWLTELRVKHLIIENVWEFCGWGPVDARTGRPLKSRKGEYFHAWIETLRRLGYEPEWRKLNSANYGEAQTRQRFILKARFDRKPIGWAPLTHAKDGGDALPLFASHIKPWRPAREIIDWSIRGKSIFNRPAPLAPKTLARILAGAIKFGWPPLLVEKIGREVERSLRYQVGKSFALRHSRSAKARKLARKRLAECVAWLRSLRSHPSDLGRFSSVEPIVVVLRNNMHGRSVGRPLPAIAAEGWHLGLAEPIVLSQHTSGRARSTGEPLPTIMTGGAASPRPGCARPALVEPFVLSQASGGAPRGVSEPLPTAPCGGAHALIAPYYGSGSGTTCQSADKPLPALTGTARFGMVVPITHSDGSHRARDVDRDPLPTLTTAKRGELAFITAQFGERPGQAPRVHHIAGPAPSICATGHINLVDADEDELDCLYRMLEWPELAAAMGFDSDDARYEFAGTKTEIIKQIGNAVSVKMMKAEVQATLADSAPKRRAAADGDFREAAE